MSVSTALILQTSLGNAKNRLCFALIHAAIILLHFGAMLLDPWRIEHGSRASAGTGN